MKYGILAAFFALATLILVFFSMIYPAWFQQTYKGSDPKIFQGFGLWAFYSSGQLSTPFLAARTTLHYGSFCSQSPDLAPNWMYGAGDKYQTYLCGKSMKAVQGLTIVAAISSILILVAAIVALYRHEAGIPERIVSALTLLGALIYSIGLIVWGWLVQQSLYQIDGISQQHQQCKVNSESWSCWFYGNSFWVALAAVISMSITGYFSSAARAEKVKKFRARFERELNMAVEASLQDGNPQRSVSVGQPATTGYAAHSTPVMGTWKSDRNIQNVV